MAAAAAPAHTSIVGMIPLQRESGQPVDIVRVKKRSSPFEETWGLQAPFLIPDSEESSSGSTSDTRDCSDDDLSEKAVCNGWIGMILDCSHTANDSSRAADSIDSRKDRVYEFPRRP